MPSVRDRQDESYNRPMQPPSLPGVDTTPALPTGAKALALLDECFEQYREKLVDIGRASIELSGDLFEGNTFVTDKDVDEFKTNRSAWVQRFEAALTDLYRRRMAGSRRKGRRPDFDASLSTLRVLTAFDQEKQAALVAATAFLERITRRELDALDLRVDALLPGERLRDIDNPFAPPYILDAIGLSARAIYPNPRVWRPFMERVVADLTPAANKVYITLNRFLADRGVLPEIKAALRARSEFRPADDKDLIPTFSKMLHDASQGLPTDVVVPVLGADGAGASVFDFTGAVDQAAETVALMLPSSVAPAADAAHAAFPGRALADGLATLERQVPASAARSAEVDALFPDLDPLMALGSSTPLFNTLGHWQRIDLPGELAKVMPQAAAAGGAAVVPLNLIPHIRAAVSAQIANPADRITMDVIGLLFDYIFRDPSIPETLRRVFGKLQVPVLKAALLDRTFFSDPRHAARRLLDDLAEAAVGATQNAAYEIALEREAGQVVEHVCRHFEIDLKVFVEADEALQRFIDAERRSTDTAVKDDVEAALAAERSESHRAEVRALVRDRLAGVELPFEVRGFIETVWSDYLTLLRRDHGSDSAEAAAALRTLDDLLWSILAKERTAQKARLTKLIPALVMGLRKGCTAVSAPPERTKSFFEALYPLHVAAIKPKPDDPAAPRPEPAAAEEATGTARGRPRITHANVHDFVSEMVVGTWLSIRGDTGAPVNARLTWVSPLRTKYIFTSRSRAEAFMFTPEELAWEIAAGRAEILLEPVPLFDRAVSAALDTLAAQRPKDASARPRAA
jgi:hypothetical protein